MDMDIVKRFICGAKEAYKKVDNHSFNFPITIESAYRLAVNIEKLLKEQEKAKVVFGRCKDGSFATECGHCGTYLDKAYSLCPKCNKELDWNSNQN